LPGAQSGYAPGPMSLFDPFPALETPRLLLRSVVPDDAAEMFRIGADPRVARFTGKAAPASIEVIRAKIDTMLAQLRAEEGITWVLTERAGGAYLGTAGLWRWDKPNARAEIGYGIDPRAWGRGLTPEALAPIVRFGFERLALHSVEAQLHPDNQASIRVLEKLGFRREAHLRENHCNQGVFEDTLVYARLVTDA
jgi:ribosomal-protein-alanine N-acetyltransferase